MKKWKLHKPITKKAAENLAAYPEFLRNLLWTRGLTQAAAAEKFLHPSYDQDLHDPFLMKDMKKTVARIFEAIDCNEKIVVYGDYDADGVPGTVVLTSYFSAIGFTNFDVYIPDRGLEGYGLKDEAIQTLVEAGTKLIITVDCGIVDVGQTAKASELGMDTIITDHHLPQKKLPKAVAVVDNKQATDKYPYKMLCGCAVAFKVVQALIATRPELVKPGWEKWLLDLVAIATVSDMVPLDGENRVLAHYGLKVLRQTRRLGLLAMLKTMKLSRENLTEDDIGFMIAPRLNVASRMAHGVQSYFLLTTNLDGEARDLAKYLDDKNNERKSMVDQIVKLVDERLVEVGTLPEIIVIGDPAWSVGGLSLVANKIKDKYLRPTFIWGGGEGVYKGSSRSTGQVNLVDLMTEAGGLDLFTEFGGHALATGFSFAPGRELEVTDKITTAYAAMNKSEVEVDIIADQMLTLDDVTWANFYFVEELGPYGVGNPKPIFWLKNIVLAGVKTFGNGGIHLELNFTNSQDKKISAIGFFACTASEKFDAVDGHIFKGAILEAGQRVDVLVNLEKSTFKKFPELRLRLVDLKPATS